MFCASQLRILRGSTSAHTGHCLCFALFSSRFFYHWLPFQDLKQAFAVSRRAEQLRLRAQQRIIATVEDSVLRTEMANLESTVSCPRCPQTYPLVQADELAGANQATSQR
jgi:hypothetical protein